MAQAAPRTPRRPLSRERIVAAALAVLDADGLDGLTMRRLADDLGSRPMSLYRHVTDRDDLLVACLDEVAVELGVAARPDDPRDLLLVVFREIHEVLGRHPWVATLLAGGELTSPRATFVVDEVLAALRRAGLAERDAALGYIALWQYTLGHLVVDHARPAPPEAQRRVVMQQATADLPTLAAVLPHFAGIDADHRFDWGLTALVDGVLDRR
jgi:AcrR family transcriptional regulator